MKVIKVGTNAQSRIAQACDRYFLQSGSLEFRVLCLRVCNRCRSKKIRCDGIRPCCSQCATVGFECKTSDKLSRRAFPRGYTESLEERVRILETEVKELKDLLDEKDEKIEMLSKIHSQSGHSQATHMPSLRRTSATQASACHTSDASEPQPARNETFKVQQSPYLLEDGGANPYFAGTSSSKTFLGS